MPREAPEEFLLAFDDLVLDRLHIQVNRMLTDEMVYRMREEFDEERSRHAHAVALGLEDQAPLDTLLARSLAFQTYIEPALAAMTISMRAELLAEKLAEQEQMVSFSQDVHFSFPANWYEHLRQTINRWAYSRKWMPMWMCRRFFKSIKLTHHKRTASATKRIVVEQFATFPASPIRTPERHSGPIRVRLERTSIR